MRWKKIAGWLVGLLAGAFFIWLALSGIDLSEVGNRLKTMETGWIFPFFVVALGANVIRALRWRMLFHEPERVNRLKIITATLVGYSANIAVPRLGEVTRAGYLAKDGKVNLGEAFASVFVERIIDVLTLLLLIVLTIVFVMSDAQVVEQVLGVPAWTVYRSVLIFIAFIGAFALGIYLLHRNRERFDRIKAALISRFPFLEKIIHIAQQALDGIIAVKHLRSWPLFVVLTGFMWTGYALMSWLPFQAIPDAALQSLTVMDAFDVMIISSIGVVIPSPSGVGTYHYFTQKALVLLHGVNAEVAIAYAIVSHAIMLLSILVSTLLFVLIERLNIKKLVSRNN